MGSIAEVLRAFSILVRLVSLPIPNSTVLQIRLDIFGYPPFYSNGVHPTSVFCCIVEFRPSPSKRPSNEYAQVLCHLATQLLSGSITEMTPSKNVVVQLAIRSGLPFN